MEVLKKILEDLFEKEYIARVSANGITLSAGDSAFCFDAKGKIIAIKRFAEVETILEPLLNKHNIRIGDFNGTIKKEMPIAVADWGNEARLKKTITSLDTEFRNRYNTLEQVYEAQLQMTADERNRFFTDPAPIRLLAMEALCNPARDLDDLFEGTLVNYEEVDKELPGMFKDQYVVALKLRRYFKEQKKL